MSESRGIKFVKIFCGISFLLHGERRFYHTIYEPCKELVKFSSKNVPFFLLLRLVNRIKGCTRFEDKQPFHIFLFHLWNIFYHCYYFPRNVLKRMAFKVSEPAYYFDKFQIFKYFTTFPLAYTKYTAHTYLVHIEQQYIGRIHARWTIPVFHKTYFLKQQIRLHSLRNIRTIPFEFGWKTLVSKFCCAGNQQTSLVSICFLCIINRPIECHTRSNYFLYVAK